MWLLDERIAQELQAAARGGLEAKHEERRAEWLARSASPVAAGERPRNMRVAGDVAEIHVSGVLVPRPSFLLWLMGYEQTSYGDIQSAIASAETDPEIKRAVFAVNSPGGHASGLFDVFAALERFTKPRVVKASTALSAAYGIAAATGGKIEATSPASEFGSVGVAIDFAFDKGEELISVTSSNAPNKRPDPHTTEGRKVITEHLDAIHDLFVDTIARGRGTTVAIVNKNFGRGAVLLAQNALKQGMIDRVVDSRPGVSATAKTTDKATAAPQQRKTNMTPAELKAMYPEAAAALVAEGRNEERDRVGAHLKMGKEAGAVEIAIKAIEAGTPMTQTMMSEYMSVGLKRRDRNMRQWDSDQVGLAADGAVGSDSQDIGDAVCARLGL